MRENVFAGQFYPVDADELSGFVRGALGSAKVDGTSVSSAVSYVAPHAGYEYSGKTAAFTYKAMQLKRDIAAVDTVIVVGPSHTGDGAPIAVSMSDWNTPLGTAANDEALSQSIAHFSEHIYLDEDAHAREHSVEVQLPFLQSALPGKRFCFICLGNQSPEASELLSNAILNASKALSRNVVVVASSDFDHYEPADVAKAKDSQLLEAMRRLDHVAFNRLVAETGDSACGFGPITTAMLFAKGVGARSGTVLNYSNSGDSTGDYSSVVAYAAVAFS